MFREAARELTELCLAVENPEVRVSVDISRSYITVVVYITKENGETEADKCYLINNSMGEYSKKQLEEARVHLIRLAYDGIQKSLRAATRKAQTIR